MNPVVRDVNINVNLTEACNSSCRCLPFFSKKKKQIGESDENIDVKVDQKSQEVLNTDKKEEINLQEKNQ